jgi:hypothetical protein
MAVDMGLAGGGVWLLREAYFRRHGFDSIGFGDVKLAAAGGILIGADGFASALLLASLAGFFSRGHGGLPVAPPRTNPTGSLSAPCLPPLSPWSGSRSDHRRWPVPALSRR